MNPDHPAARHLLTDRARTITRTVRAHCGHRDITAVACDEDTWDLTDNPRDRAIGWGRVEPTLLGAEFRFSPTRIARNTLHLPGVNDDQDRSVAAYIELVLMWITAEHANPGSDRSTVWAHYETLTDQMGWVPTPVRFLFEIHSAALDRVCGQRADLTRDSTWASLDIDFVTDTNQT